MSYVPAKCYYCGVMFPVKSWISGTIQSSMINCGVTCKNCGNIAKVADNYTDSKGNLHFRDLFGYIRSINDSAKLEAIKQTLEAANDQVLPEQLADALVDIDSSLNRFKNLISRLPASEVYNFITTLLGILALILSYISYTSSEENHSENISIQKSQLDLARSQFEYQKSQDAKRDAESVKKNSDIESFENRLHELEVEFEYRLLQIENQDSQVINSKSMKGSDRNKPCPCGSGKKYKKCHPRGLN